ncbi:hypothetical protein A0H81_13571 [Grifola frondosa]|uniref:Aip3p/Bud6 N-terminal domain-containing protein n=1 Tax=Grifola frondosa TaxID=5627 RepID=A0A1C7LNS8_GRIFR|nr:hypothetical protein A0H81_13571 [Grifola frondosa]
MAYTESRRNPKSAYRGTNGFVDPVRTKIQGAVPATNYHAVLAEEDPPSTSKRELRDAVQRRPVREDMMELKGTYFPGLAALKTMNEMPETADSIKERIKELRRRHFDEVRTLYQWQGQDYHQDAIARAQSSQSESTSDPHIYAHYQAARKRHAGTAFDDDLSRHHHAHLTALLPLVRRRTALREREEAARRLRDAQFPPSLDVYRAIQNKDVQVRVARFLMADTNTKERMLSEFNWAWRQVKPLEDEYEHNAQFKSEIQGRVREVEAHDPRLRHLQDARRYSVSRTSIHPASPGVPLEDKSSVELWECSAEKEVTQSMGSLSRAVPVPRVRLDLDLATCERRFVRLLGYADVRREEVRSTAIERRFRGYSWLQERTDCASSPRRPRAVGTLGTAKGKAGRGIQGQKRVEILWGRRATRMIARCSEDGSFLFPPTTHRHAGPHPPRSYVVGQPLSVPSWPRRNCRQINVNTKTPRPPSSSSQGTSSPPPSPLPSPSSSSSSRRTESEVHSAVSRLLGLTKQLQDVLRLWAVRQAGEAQVSDAFVLVGTQFHATVNAFWRLRVDTSDLYSVPVELRTLLESLLAEEPSPAVLDAYMPEVRRVLYRLLEGLRSKQAPYWAAVSRRDGRTR